LKLIKDESDVKIGYWKDEVSSHWSTYWIKIWETILV
jgi:hypothetical protein